MYSVILQNNAFMLLTAETSFKSPGAKHITRFRRSEKIPLTNISGIQEDERAV
jgi:hypothetical protein